MANENRLISADEARRRIIAFATGLHSEVIPVDTVMMLLAQVPAVDTVPLVRCKECVWSHMRTDPKTLHSAMVCGYKGYNPVQSSQVTADDFCSHGESKEGAD